jgi:hypothetical protein
MLRHPRPLRRAFAATLGDPTWLAGLFAIVTAIGCSLALG